VTGSVRLAGAVGRQAPLPRVELFSPPTPLDPLPRFGEALRAIAAEGGHDGPTDVWMKREDLIGIGLGGNKVRNLEFHLGAAVEGGADVAVTSGRGRANHCRLTAAAAARAGLRCVLVLSGPRPLTPSPNERILELLGAELRYAEDESLDRREELLAQVVEELRAAGSTPYLVPLGASGPVGASGQVVAGLELADQLAAAGITADSVLVGAATGGTYSGLRVGLWLAGSGARVIGVPTYFSSAGSEVDFRRHLAELLVELRALWAPDGGEAAAWDDQVVLDDLTDWLPYWTASSAATAAARLLGMTEGICAEPVYTARVLAAAVAWARAGRLDSQTVVLWHGGGTPALFEDYGAPDGDGV
jgi:1-aminocyclopropane-1-carboxylate deaminase/D-cysteine desulfhydrase-like pyridoxal-dependent ACC family enzyme